MSVTFSTATEKQFQNMLQRYETKASALLPTLYLAQQEFGYLRPDVMEYVAERLEMPAVHVVEAAHFYSMFKKKDMGKYCLQICNNISCHNMNGGHF